MSLAPRDKHGNEILAGDVLKVFHYTGARKKRYYMYKEAVENRGYVCARHLGIVGSHEAGTFRLTEENPDIEIVEAGGYDPERKLKGPCA